MATTRFGQAKNASGRDAAERSKEYVQRHWKYHNLVSDSPQAGLIDLAGELQRHSLCISGMAFQDVWNVDLERLRRCCIHVITKNKKLVPFCAYYLTDTKGRRLAEQ